MKEGFSSSPGRPGNPQAWRVRERGSQLTGRLRVRRPSRGVRLGDADLRSQPRKVEAEAVGQRSSLGRGKRGGAKEEEENLGGRNGEAEEIKREAEKEF